MDVQLRCTSENLNCVLHNTTLVINESISDYFPTLWKWSCFIFGDSCSRLVQDDGNLLTLISSDSFTKAISGRFRTCLVNCSSLCCILASIMLNYFYDTSYYSKFSCFCLWLIIVCSCYLLMARTLHVVYIGYLHLILIDWITGVIN